MDVRFKRTINTEEARSYMKLAVTTESKDRLKYYLDLLGYHHITSRSRKLNLWVILFRKYVYCHIIIKLLEICGDRRLKQYWMKLKYLQINNRIG